ncbi:7SK snRNA methylphosphate capping enzyme-like [Alosa alosa]|uniref:7SK snRNA methylphosphate capping enzyme-like n=1 Tax=Alosa alosa TaxID=278164 RepID=UPI00201524AB|nr:7SK snRNA methylphosphate capping enzyme-like [Alosa alosa]
MGPPPQQHMETDVAASTKDSSNVSKVHPSASPQPVSDLSLAPPRPCKRKSSSCENGENSQGPVTVRKQQQPKKKKFEYGNYSQYYGYRYLGLNDDPRLRAFRREWFQGRTVLDIGCNAGHVTLFIAKHWKPSRIVGMDIDGGLIYTARQNIKHYLSDTQAKEDNDSIKDADPAGGEVSGNSVNAQVKEAEIENNSGSQQEGQSTPRMSGNPSASVPLPHTPSNPPGNFPENVCFVRGNYVLESDQLLVTQREEYNVILCLSVTKWIHLNWGDAGLKRLFRRVYKHLLPGGLFILEPQPWDSYNRRRKLTDSISKNYASIQLKPDMFASYLTSEVGFGGYKLIGTPKSSSQGFERPIYVFHKDNAPSEQVA